MKPEAKLNESSFSYESLDLIGDIKIATRAFAFSLFQDCLITAAGSMTCQRKIRRSIFDTFFFPFASLIIIFLALKIRLIEGPDGPGTKSIA